MYDVRRQIVTCCLARNDLQLLTDVQLNSTNARSSSFCRIHVRRIQVNIQNNKPFVLVEFICSSIKQIACTTHTSFLNCLPCSKTPMSPYCVEGKSGIIVKGMKLSCFT